MAGSRHLRAVNASIRARGLERSPSHAAIVALVRDLAREMDAAGADASGRLQERYRGALKQLGRPTDAPVAATRVTEPNVLQKFAIERGIGDVPAGVTEAAAERLRSSFAARTKSEAAARSRKHAAGDHSQCSSSCSAYLRSVG